MLEANEKERESDTHRCLRKLGDAALVETPFRAEPETDFAIQIGASNTPHAIHRPDVTLCG